ncbi:MAG: hypothetical protein WAO98_07970 [Alphaproteobacteria bacterium]
MTALASRRLGFLDIMRSMVSRSPKPHELGGFVMNGGEFRDGPPPPPPPPPPSRYDTFAAIDDKLTRDMPSVPEVFSSPPPPVQPAPIIPREDRPYTYEVFKYVAETAGLEQTTFIDENLTVRGTNTPGQVTIHHEGYAAELNRQHREEHGPDSRYQEPHMVGHMVVSFKPDVQPAMFERSFSSELGNIEGSSRHEVVFCAPVGSISMDELKVAAERYAQNYEPDSIADVRITNPDAVVTRSIVAPKIVIRGTDGTLSYPIEYQYMVHRGDAKFTERPNNDPSPGG